MVAFGQWLLPVEEMSAFKCFIMSCQGICAYCKSPNANRLVCFSASMLSRWKYLLALLCQYSWVHRIRSVELQAGGAKVFIFVHAHCFAGSFGNDLLLRRTCIFGQKCIILSYLISSQACRLAMIMFIATVPGLYDCHWQAVQKCQPAVQACLFTFVVMHAKWQPKWWKEDDLRVLVQK